MRIKWSQGCSLEKPRWKLLASSTAYMHDPRLLQFLAQPGHFLGQRFQRGPAQRVDLLVDLLEPPHSGLGHRGWFGNQWRTQSRCNCSSSSSSLRKVAAPGLAASSGLASL